MKPERSSQQLKVSHHENIETGSETGHAGNFTSLWNYNVPSQIATTVSGSHATASHSQVLGSLQPGLGRFGLSESSGRRRWCLRLLGYPRPLRGACKPRKA